MAEINPSLEIWKATIDVQKHFNELSLRVRSIAVTVLGAFLAAAGYALKESKTVDFLGQQVSLTGTILLGALVCWAAFFVMDRLWYHRLLRAAVSHGRKVEEGLQAIPNVGLTSTIDDASPLWGMRAGHRLSLFYGFIAVLLWLGAGTALRAGTPYYIIGDILLLVALALEFSARSDANRRRGFIRLGIVAAGVYFGWWALQGWYASYRLPGYLRLSQEATDKHDWDLSTLWVRYANDASADINESVVWGIAVPLGVVFFALIAGLLLYWIHRGFRPRR
jgi:hypothetical protein